ncbi:glycosyltransferase family 4 protein [uncultured Thiodictyon sp.]|uniref:glycosyltransferase family 4 protein n=1 Tax=uncultured Thiodictyon sp. TaxID=1846217 RepID=UPI0025FD6EC0|nr:glycosyltransferase family 4 protein [uncultured Thiodictyon sp.]
MIHLIPYEGVGGVETAARTMHDVAQTDVSFDVGYIYRPATVRKTLLGTYNPIRLVTAVVRIVSHRPDVLIVSLWRSAIVGLLVKLLCPRLKLVLFLHCPKDVHLLDRLVTRLAARAAGEIWADSNETLARRLLQCPTHKGRVISFVTHRLAALSFRPVTPVFIFWGRLHPQKGLERALRIFSGVRDRIPSARFMIIGPNGGDLVRLNRCVEEMALGNVVSFLGEMPLKDIVRQARAASFYLQASQLEGMAMSVVEAMQLGLVPVVTPVGEIASYCKHRENALIISSDESAVKEILAVVGDDARYRLLRDNAVATWAEQPLYAQSVLQACRAILSNDTGREGRQLEQS